MTGEQKSIAELVEAARKLEASAPSIRELVLAEVRSAGYAVRIAVNGGPSSSTVHRFSEPRGLDAREGMRDVGLVVSRSVNGAHEVTYAEFAGRVFPQWAGWSEAENDASIRALLHTIRAARR